MGVCPQKIFKKIASMIPSFTDFGKFKPFMRIYMYACACMYVCVPPLRLQITSGVIWISYDELNNS